MTDKTQQNPNPNAFESVIRQATHGGPIQPLPEGTFTMPRFSPNEGEWAFAIDCPKCQKTTPIFRDLAEGQFPRPWTGQGKVRADCQFCPHTIVAPSENIHSVQWS